MADKIDVFIIDDDSKQMQYFQTILNHTELIRCIGSTTSGEKGLGTILTAYPDVILVDYALYPTSGFDIIARIRDDMPTLPIILLGGRAHLREKAEKAGASAYLPKPVTPRVLIDTIHKVHSDKAHVKLDSDTL